MSTSTPLTACGCCQGTEELTPAAVTNVPGLSALVWRVGTQARFKQSLLAGLSTEPALRPLTTRDDGDPGVALLDAWAVALDILTFYQERLANEHYLRTATELRSVVELARAIGYELAPGVAASTLLAYTLETAPGAPLVATVAAGSKAQSIPGQDEKPQLFETAEELSARAAWNSMPAQTRGQKTPFHGQTVIQLAGVSTGLQPGEGLLLVGDERLNDSKGENWDFRRVRAVQLVTDNADPARSYTEVTLDRPLGSVTPFAMPAKKSVRVFALRQRAGLFGYNAPDWRVLPDETRTKFLPAGKSLSNYATNWPDFSIGYTDTYPVDAAAFKTLYLDTTYKTAVAGTWLVVTADNVEGGASYEELYRITKSEESAQARFAVTGKSTKVTLSGENLAEKFWAKLREAAVFLQTDELVLTERPVTDAVAAGCESLELDVLLSGDDILPAGRVLLLSGAEATTGEPVAEAVELKFSETFGDGGEPLRTRLWFASKLLHSYRRDSLRVLGNVVPATHGETKAEVLGSGNGAVPFQKFVLKQTPLTYVSAANASGRASTLVVLVDGVRWREVPSFFGVGPEEQVYVTRRSDVGAVTVQFGDGRTGVRLPTGSENITATYRVGIGLGGLVDAGQISLLMSRPLGVKEVTNPKASEGADDPETLATARTNAPLTVLTLDRVVSLQDYEDFARAFAGIGKAAVTLLWTGEVQSVHLTVALADGSAPEDDSPTVATLRSALNQARHALRPVLVQGHIGRPFRVAAKVAVDPAYLAEEVIADATRALLEHFAFEQRDLAQDVTTAEVIAALQGVKGVVFVDLDQLAFLTGGAAVDGRLEAQPARFDGGSVHAADLLTLAETDIQLTVIAP